MGWCSRSPHITQSVRPRSRVWSSQGSWCFSGGRGAGCRPQVHTGHRNLSSPSVMSAAHEQDTTLTGLAIVSTHKKEHLGKTTQVLLKFPREAMSHPHSWHTISLIVVFSVFLYFKTSFLILCARGTRTIEMVFTSQCPQTLQHQRRCLQKNSGLILFIF